MHLALARRITTLAWPVLVAQVAYMGVAAADTVFVGHYSTTHLAALAIANAIQITVVVALVGVLQAVGPVVAHHFGAGREQEIAAAWQQGAWLALALSALGFLILRHSAVWVAWSGPSPEVAQLADAYLRIAAFAVPAHLLYRTFYAFSTALGNSRALMVITTLGSLLNLPLSYGLIFGKLGLPPLGALGAAYAYLAVAWASLAAALATLAAGRFYRKYRVFARWPRPHWPAQRELLRVGLPMGLSNLIEISSFTFIALFIAPLGAEVQAGHRIVANVVGIAFMAALALGLATSALVGQALGAREPGRARATATTGLALAALLATALGLAVTLGARPLVAAYSDDLAVRAVALSLIGYAAVFHFFDATQTLASFALRGYKVTMGPMLVHALCFWGIGLGGGYWLAFRAAAPMGAAGFWLASTASLMVAALLVGAYLALVARAVRQL